MTLKQLEKGIFVDDATKLNFDSIIFDCDGVLIDVTKSYDQAIAKTTAYILKEFAKIQNSIPITKAIIEGFKDTGGFNDEVDLTYVAVLSIVAAKKLDTNEEKFIDKVIKNADETGITSVEKFLEKRADISDIKKKLAYPGKRVDNPLHSIFDQLFYGPKLYKKLFKKESKFTEQGFIENDVTIITKKLVETLKKRFDNKIAIVTGRGIESIRYSLKEILDGLNLKNCVFLEDESREIAKPNPEPLLRAIRGLGSKNCLYVGDSMEDLIMAKKATDRGFNTTFCGIYGTSRDPLQKIKFFEQNKVPIIIESILHLPKILNLV